jgi:hypothetical protein
MENDKKALRTHETFRQVLIALLQVVVENPERDADEVIPNVHVSWRVVVLEVVEFGLVGLEILIAEVPGQREIKV